MAGKYLQVSAIVDATSEEYQAAAAFVYNDTGNQVANH